MAITIRQQLSSGAGGNQSHSMTSAVSGDLVLLIQWTNFYTLANLITPTGTAVTTWTQRHSLDGGTDSVHLKVWTGVVTTAGGTAIANRTSGDDEGYSQVVVFADAEFDTVASTNGTGTSSVSHPAPSVTPTGGKTDDQLVCSWAMYNDNSINYTLPGSMTAFTEQDVSGIATYRSGSEQLTTDSATGTRTATSSEERNPWATVSVLVKSVTTGTNAPAESASGTGVAYDAFADVPAVYAQLRPAVVAP